MFIKSLKQLVLKLWCLDNHVYLRVGEEWGGVLEMWVPGLRS